MSIITVGVGKDHATLASAIGASAAGDTILVDAGTYTDDFTNVNHALTIRGVGGMAHFVAVAQPPNGKAIMTVTADLTIDQLEFSGATVADQNGAGIRYEGGHLVITNSWFHDNENGILAAPSAGGTISIDRSEFNNNGFGDGRTHNIYVNQIDNLTITNSYFHDVNVGHEIKSRALVTNIIGNRITDGPSLSASYSIDLPDGGQGTVRGNIIEKGLLAQNRTFIHLGGEANPSYSNTSLLVQDNTFIFNTASGAPTVLRNNSVVAGANAPASLIGNTFYGITAGQLALGTATISGSVFPGGTWPGPDLSHPFGNAACFARGTRLVGPWGGVAVEDLRAGDWLATASGGRAQVGWIGFRDVSCRGHARPWDVHPVRVRQGAFGVGLPARDLRLSPDHAVYVDGVLMPVRALLNGATVVQEPVDQLRYFHVELIDEAGQAMHGVVLAEGLPVESYLDTGNRSDFANGGPVVALHPHFAREDHAEHIWAQRACAPLVVAGPQVQRVRDRLLARAAMMGWGTTEDAELCLAVGAWLLRPAPGPMQAGIAVFLLPPNATAGVLRSRQFVPAHMSSDSDDHRCLGVAVTRLSLDGRIITAPAAGWHDAEPGRRWTDGAGTIALDGARLLVVVLAPGGRYWQDAASGALTGTNG